MIQNPRFPHKVIITRTGERKNPFDEAKEQLIYDGKCRNYISNKPSNAGVVSQSDYTISAPIIETEIKKGDKVVVTEKVRTIEGRVVDSYVGNIGSNIYWNKDGN